jgi:4-hydroxybenzoate polyprenyltransferase
VPEEKPISLAAIWRLTRLPNLAIIAITQYFTATFLIGDLTIYTVLYDLKFHFLVVSTASIAAAGYIINDYYDIKIDLINKPERVVIGSSLKRRKAMLGHTFLNFFGIGVALLISLKLALIVFLAAFWLWLYSNQLKRWALIGNISVALLTALSLLLVGVYYNNITSLIKAYALFAFSISLVREIIKDMEDLRGDARYGAKTLPIIWGIRRTKTLLYVLSGFFVVLIFFVAYKIQNQFLILYFFSLGILIGLFWLKLYHSDTKNEYHQLSNYCKVFMLAGIISMTFL